MNNIGTFLNDAAGKIFSETPIAAYCVQFSNRNIYHQTRLNSNLSAYGFSHIYITYLFIEFCVLIWH